MEYISGAIYPNTTLFTQFFLSLSLSLTFAERPGRLSSAMGRGKWRFFDAFKSWQKSGVWRIKLISGMARD